MTQTRWPDAARMFALDAQYHTLTVVRDDGFYRHLRFRSPDTHLYWYDLICWPGHLCFTGDYGTWVFARQPDMINFFAANAVTDINPGYWAEKVTAGETRAYSEDRARQLVTEAVDEHIADRKMDPAPAAALLEQVQTELLSEDVLPSEDTFRAAVRDFYWSASGTRMPEQGDVFSFGGDSWWEWDLRDFRFQYLWACFAIRHGVNRYLDTRNPNRRPMPALGLPPVPRTTPPTTAEVLAITSPPRTSVTKQPRKDFL